MVIVARISQTRTGIRSYPCLPDRWFVHPTEATREAEQVAPPANDDRKPATVTIKRKSARFADVPDLTPEARPPAACARALMQINDGDADQ